MPKATLRFIAWVILSVSFLGALVATGLSLYLNSRLPPVEQLRKIKLQVPLRIYSADNQLIAEFGEKRRSPIPIESVPPLFIKAIFAAEDDGFEHHHGVDFKSLARAFLQLITTGKIQTGGSTITMQVAKNYFLSHERTFSRKFNEILLALQIEQELSKPEILELYVNKIYLGNRAYGVQAAAQVYYGKDIKELNLAQLAMIAGLPKAPSSYNPIINQARALIRRNWILQRMQHLNYISPEQYADALDQPATAGYHGQKSQLEAPYLAEMVRAKLLESYSQEDLYTTGIQVFTTIRGDLQAAANKAIKNGLLAYDRRHGYRGPGRGFLLDPDAPVVSAAEHLKSVSNIGPLLSAIVLDVQEKNITALLRSGEQVMINWDGLKWAKAFKTTNLKGPKPSSAYELVKIGDQVRVMQDDSSSWVLSQVPQAQAAFVALNPNSGALLALNGGFNFQHSKYNRATQAARQPGSNFKPFIYTAALEAGYTAASLVNDAPVVFDDPLLENTWRPENYSGKFFGPTRLRKALYKSRNMVSIRLLQALTVSKAISYAGQLGFDPQRLPRDLSLALGSAEFTPLEIVTGYAIFANGGYRVTPYFIGSIKSYDGDVIFEETPWQVCPKCELARKRPGQDKISPEDQLKRALLDEITYNQVSNTPPENYPQEIVPPLDLSEIRLPDNFKAKILAAPRVIEERAAYIMNSILMDVIRYGTGRRAQSLGRKDLAGKTGTTNDQKDAWFSGYNRNLVATGWVGFDQPQTLGRYETGGRAALPIWIEFMRSALDGVPEAKLSQPEGIVSIRIDPVTGRRALPGQSNAIFELFRAENIPEKSFSTTLENMIETPPEQLF